MVSTRDRFRKLRDSYVPATNVFITTYPHSHNECVPTYPQQSLRHIPGTWCQTAHCCWKFHTLCL